MKIVISANGPGLDAEASPIFGRSSTYTLVDTDTMAFETLGNPATAAAEGAGIQAAQFIVAQGAQAVISGNVGPNAFEVLRAAEIPVYLFEGGTVRQAVEAFRQGQLRLTSGASGPAHAGMGRGKGRGQQVITSSSPPSPTRQQEVDELRQMAADLRRQLATVMERLERLEKENQ